MHATLRRYEGIDESRIDELGRKVNEGLLPKLSELPGFKGYVLMDAGNGAVSSITLFETSSQADDSNRAAAAWTQEEDLGELIPNAPKVTVRKVIAYETKAPVLA